MPHLIPLSRLARLVGQPRSVLQRMAQQGEFQTFDGHVDLEEVLRLFPDVKLENDAELKRVEEIKEQALHKTPEQFELADSSVMHERLRALGRDYAAAQGKLLHYERVTGWIGGKLGDGVERGLVTPAFADEFATWLKRELAAPAGNLRRWEELLARERVMRVMSAQVKVLPKGQTFEVIGDETILEAGIRAGLPMPYGCANGSCGDCKCRVAAGEVMRVRPHDYVLSGSEKQQGYTLACSYTAVGDVDIEVPLVGVSELPEQALTARVREVEPLGGDRVAVHLMTPRAERLRYFAGQLLEITVDGETRRVPAASCPCDERRIEVHILCDAPDAGKERPFSSLRKNAEVEVRGPYGGFVLDDQSERAVLLIAEGAGFAQIKSMLQHALSLEHAPSISLVRIANAEGLYQENLLKSYAGALDNFRYVPFAADAGSETLAQAIAREMGKPTEVDVYAAGSADFVSTLKARCLSLGLPEKQWLSEVIG